MLLRNICLGKWHITGYCEIITSVRIQFCEMPLLHIFTPLAPLPNLHTPLFSPSLSHSHIHTSSLSLSSLSPLSLNTHIHARTHHTHMLYFSISYILYTSYLSFTNTPFLSLSLSISLSLSLSVSLSHTHTCTRIFSLSSHTHTHTRVKMLDSHLNRLTHIMPVTVCQW